ncbi:hypothetical protein D3C76_1071660 [compost metagenome]
MIGPLCAQAKPPSPSIYRCHRHWPRANSKALMPPCAMRYSTSACQPAPACPRHEPWPSAGSCRAAPWSWCSSACAMKAMSAGWPAPVRGSARSFLTCSSLPAAARHWHWHWRSSRSASRQPRALPVCRWGCRLSRAWPTRHCSRSRPGPRPWARPWPAHRPPCSVRQTRPACRPCANGLPTTCAAIAAYAAMPRT